jgi:hypothetical protein
MSRPRGAYHLPYKGLESVTQGLARATSHRVLAPAAGTSPRYSIPFFQNIAQDLRLSELVLQRTFISDTFRGTGKLFSLAYPFRLWAVPPEVLKLKGRRGGLGQTDCESESAPTCVDRSMADGLRLRTQQ